MIIIKFALIENNNSRYVNRKLCLNDPTKLTKKENKKRSDAIGRDVERTEHREGTKQKYPIDASDTHIRYFSSFTLPRS